jgi:hypothetical protein
MKTPKFKIWEKVMFHKWKEENLNSWYIIDIKNKLFWIYYKISSEFEERDDNKTKIMYFYTKQYLIKEKRVYKYESKCFELEEKRINKLLNTK